MGHRQTEQVHHGPERQRLPDDHSGQVEELLHEDDRRVEEQAEHRRPEHLLEDVARQDLHESQRILGASGCPDGFPQRLLTAIM